MSTRTRKLPFEGFAEKTTRDNESRYFRLFMRRGQFTLTLTLWPDGRGEIVEPRTGFIEIRDKNTRWDPNQPRRNPDPIYKEVLERTSKAALERRGRWALARYTTTVAKPKSRKRRWVVTA